MNETVVKKRLSKAELGWLGGIVDGEGCLYFAIRTDYPTHRSIRCDVRICMSHHATIDRVADMLVSIIGDDDAVGLYTEKRTDGKKRERPLRDATVHGRKSVLRLLRVLRPYLFTKALEADLALEYLVRSAHVVRYRATERDHLLARAATALRDGRGETRARQLLSQVIPSQAEGSEATRTSDGLETRSVRNAANKPTHECPATSPVQLKLVGRLKR